MNSLFDDLKQGLEEAIDLQKSVGIAKTDMNMPIRKYSKEEYKELVEHVGKWVVSSIGKIDADSTSYRAAVARYDKSMCDDVVICAGLKDFGWPVLIGISNHEAETIAPVYGISGYDVFSRPESRAYKVNGDDMYDYNGIVQTMGEVHDGS